MKVEITMEKQTNVKEEMEVSVQQLQAQGLVLPKNITDKVFNTLSVYQSQGTVSFPQNYSVGNALKAAYLIYQGDPKLQACEPSTVANALLDMCISGLNPSKNQCYFIPMGKQCTLMTSYFGKQTMVKRIKGVKDVRSDVIYKDTEYELLLDDYGNDDIEITKACPLDKRKGDNIIAAWARIILDPEVWGVDSYVAIMTLEDIENSWSQGSGYGKSKTHTKFKAEMAKKTAINRCIKNFINTRDDQDILIDVINRTTANEYKDHNDVYNDVQGEVIEVQATETIEMPQAAPRAENKPVQELKQAQGPIITPEQPKQADTSENQGMEW